MSVGNTNLSMQALTIELNELKGTLQNSIRERVRLEQELGKLQTISESERKVYDERLTRIEEKVTTNWVKFSALEKRIYQVLARSKN